MDLNKFSSAPEFLLGGLAHAFFWLDESLQQSMEKSGYKRVSRTQSMIIIYVSAGIARPSVVAKALGISRQAIHQALQEMNDRKILELKPDLNDKRAKIICFCPQADKIRLAAATILVEIEKKLETRIGKDALSALKDGLKENWGAIVKVDLNQR